MIREPEILYRMRTLMTNYTPNDIAEMVLNGLRTDSRLNPHAFLDSGDDAPDGAPLILLRPDGGDVWMLRIEGPMPVGTPEEMVEVAVRAGFVDPE